MASRKTFKRDEPVEARFRFGGAGRNRHTGPWEPGFYLGELPAIRRHEVRDRFGVRRHVTAARIRKVDVATWVPGSTVVPERPLVADEDGNVHLEPAAAASIEPAELEPRWVEIDRFAVQTASIVIAGRVAAKLNKRRVPTRQSGVTHVDGAGAVTWMCLARFRAEVAARAGKPADVSSVNTTGVDGVHIARPRARRRS